MDTALSLSAVSPVDEGPPINNVSSSSPSTGTECLEIVSCRRVCTFICVYITFFVINHSAFADYMFVDA